MKAIRWFVTTVDLVNEKVGLLTSWLTTLLVITVCLDVFTRYLLNNSSVAVQEMEWHIFATIFLIGSAYTLKHNKHVRVDVLYMNFTPKSQALVNCIGSLLFLMPFAVMAVWSSQDFVLNSINLGEISPDPGGLPARFILKSMIPIGFFLICLQGLSMASRSFVQFLNDGLDVIEENAE